MAGEQRKSETIPVYVISIAAELAGVHPRTLRIYEEKGLIRPARRNQIRLFSDRDLQRVRLIQVLTRQHGLNLAGVKLFLELEERHEEVAYHILESRGIAVMRITTTTRSIQGSVGVNLRRRSKR
ncbi:MAG: MerR family transcriptional regulator [Armatimonadetes bacterium]|nr:MerR family transcriptional regulator [Armatimonadota bacterium]